MLTIGNKRARGKNITDNKQKRFITTSTPAFHTTSGLAKQINY